MYLPIFLYFLLINTRVSESNCGCELNREKTNSCGENAENKYSKTLNEKESKIKFEFEDMILVNSSTFSMGTDKPIFPSDFEGPIRNVSFNSFYLDKYEVSNKNFMDFVDKTAYKTEAENFGDSFIFEMFIPEEIRKKYDHLRAVQAPWWIKMEGVSWKHPEGPQSNIEDNMDHPVIHVSWNDAVQYCSHFGKRLPTEIEWEAACRGGLHQKLYPWGNKIMPKNQHWTNIWQGKFPEENTKEDGYVSTAPIGTFPPNNFGLYDMAGNVWEWTQDSWASDTDLKVKKGGSFLCHESYCWRYRCAARSHNTADTSASNLGFRCAADVK